MAEMNSNYLQIVPNDFINMVAKVYSNKALFEKIPTMMLWGMPGVGKSQAVKQAGEALAEKTAKKVNVTVASLLLMNPIDLRGIPSKEVTDAGEAVARWLTPEIFQMDASDDVINILFLDEISAAPPSVQAAAYQICLDKRIGEHNLPKNCIVIAAGNRITDKAVAYKMPKPLGNRLTHFEMIPSVEDWKRWAYNNEIDTRIIAFIHAHNKYLCQFNPQSDDVAFATPRSWEMVNTYLQLGEATKDANSIETYFSCIAGTVGLGVAQEFKTYVDVYDSLPSWEDIESGVLKQIPKNIATNRPDIMFALSSMIASKVTTIGKDVNVNDEKSVNAYDDMITNVFTFVDSFKAREFVTLVARDICTASSNTVVRIIFDNKKFAKCADDIGDMIL